VTTTQTPGADVRRQPTQRPRKPRRYGAWLLNAVLVVAVLWAALGLEDLGLDDLLGAPATLWSIFSLMFGPPDWSYFQIAFEGMLESLQIAWIGTLIAAVVSLPMGFLAAKNVTARTGSTVARQVLNAIRSVPELILAIVFIPIVGLGAVAGALAIGVHSIGTLGKLSSEVIEGIDTGPVEAARATGASQSGVMRWGVLPQVLPEIVAFWLYRFEVNIRAAAILGIVGAGGVGSVLQNTISFRRWDKAGMTIIVVVVVTMLVDTISSAIRRRIISGAPAARSRRYPPGEAMG